MGLSLPQLLVILVIVIVLFGTKRLKNLGGDLGEAISGFRKAVKAGDQTGSLAVQRPEVLAEAVVEHKQSGI